MIDDIINQMRNSSMSTDSTPTRRIQRVRHELLRRDVEVVRIEAQGPNFLSITFQGESLDSFVSDSFDDHIKFMFPDAAGEMVRRDYTPRRFNRERRELTVEFALHGEGLASDWARSAVVGQRAVIGGPRGSMIVPMDYAWHLLVGDASALPAIHRRLEELPADTQAIAVIQVDEVADRRALTSAARLDLQWVTDAQQLVAAVRALDLPPGEGFVWCAGEASVMAELRALLLQEKSHPKEAMKVAAYWKPGASDFHENLDH
jgi:NADPH-dependent ferric siderophore reductase